MTCDLPRRVVDHREATFGGFTARYDVERLVHFEMAATMHAAIARENQLERHPRDWKRNLVARENPPWRDLAEGFGSSPLPEG